MRWAFEHMQATDGGSVYLRLTTRQIAQPERDMTTALARRRPGRRLLAGATAARGRAGLVVHRCGGARGAGRRWRLCARTCRRPACCTSPRPTGCTRTGGRNGARPTAAAACSAPLAADAALVTVLDGHPATLSWLGAVRGHRVRALGVDRFGQSADIPDLYRVHGIDADAILDACAAALLRV